MHISEGVLSMPILAAGVAVAAAGVAVGMKKMGGDSIQGGRSFVGLFSWPRSTTFPSVRTSVHLVLNGLLGILLGWPAFPAILVALFLQAMLFQFGGWTTLGIQHGEHALPDRSLFLILSPGPRKEGRTAPPPWRDSGRVSFRGPERTCSWPSPWPCRKGPFSMRQSDLPCPTCPSW
jgi:cobalt/nickel transport system permease protein